MSFFDTIRSFFAKLFGSPAQPPDAVNAGMARDLGLPSSPVATSRDKIKITCPYCLDKMETEKDLPELCSHCEKELPPMYTDNYRRLPITASQIFGWTSHGKTTYLAALALVLERMSGPWPNFTMIPATESGRRKILEVRQYNDTGLMPQPTPLNADDCFVLLLENMAHWRHRTLVLRDCSGESFDHFAVSPEQAPFLLRAPTTMMFVSPDDLELNQRGLQGDPENPDLRRYYSMDMLMTNYINTLTKHNKLHGSRNTRNVVVVITKADKIVDIPQSLRNYLLDDPIWSVIGSDEFLETDPPELNSEAVNDYLQGMYRADREIQRWLGLKPSGRLFINQAKNRGINLRFSLTSSTGGDIDPEQAMAWEPRRVLDPFFWTLELEKTS